MTKKRTSDDLNEVLDSLVHEVDADLALGSRALELVLEELGKLRLGQAAFRVRTRSN